MEKLSKDEVLHVLNLARLEATEEEIEKYQVDLWKMIREIDKIKEMNDFDDDILIAPWISDTKMRDIGSVEVSKSDVFQNVPRKKGNFVVVDSEVLKDE